MIKNIILDVGGILFDDSKDNIEKILGKDCDYIYKTAYGKEFQKCLLGKLSIQEYINSFQNEKDFNDIKYILEKDNLKKSYPLIENNFEFIKKLKKDGYKLFLLTNITEDSYNSVHTLRHTCATILYKSGYDIKLIQEILGHSSVNTTKIYTHLYDKEVEKTMQEHPLAHFKMKNAMEFCAL